MKNTPTAGNPPAEDALAKALRERRTRQLAQRVEPTDPASGTSRVAARLARARAEALATPLRPRRGKDAAEMIGLT